ncbi:hypothetical protein A3L04_00025 [Thermococcus chitonophagus]|uniref:Uncharacterized protein n=1 Tax=Thermococcus chitonophagus TaxID=54262 RepID=A0A170T2J8_9EURY|nr:hypothetical protein [Thermococcus chitonophagus]ASJ15574.1 hypothetical protein A3L04_00025 [Thermococcus chitonophagus]CUX78931.1 hypothetical protein CHITON_2152 [Thermococcus chitonophagus]
MKTIAVDEETWEAIKKLKAKLDAKSYSEVLKKLIEVWHLVELDMKAEKVALDEDEADLVLSILKDREKYYSLKTKGGTYNEKTTSKNSI